MLNKMQYALPSDIEAAVNAELERWSADKMIARIWQKNARVWTGDDEANWLGWLDIIDQELADVGKYRELQAEAAKFSHVLLMGMGGSSLCPEVLATTFGKTRFHILDSTDPAQIRTTENKLDISKTLFIVASKSGSTLEPNIFKQYFFERLAKLVGRDKAGNQFVAITDPGSKMEQIAKNDGFRHIFYGKPEIGGRFSALSAFGMTAAAAMGLNVERFLENAGEMAAACKNDDPLENPGALLGIVLGICHAAGRDKLTIFTSPEVRDLGAWLEQLIAESTGKNGVAIIPVDREPVIDAPYSGDRVFALLGIGDAVETRFRELTEVGHPAVMIRLGSIDNLGQEFFRWEFATAVAGSIMRINPFNQPDVESAKIEARKLTDEYEKKGRLPSESPFFEAEGLQFYTDADQSAQLSGGVPAEVLRSHLDRIGKGDYFALLAYVEMSSEHERILEGLRESVLKRYGCATCLGFGPRFLHSTGQAYKGGGNNGVFLQITCDDVSDLPVPGQKYTFGVVKAAQSRGDFQVLLDRRRRALRVHIGSNVNEGLEQLASMI
jgi:transaldolase/glucose-6-phosphate isomerase